MKARQPSSAQGRTGYYCSAAKTASDLLASRLAHACHWVARRKNVQHTIDEVAAAAAAAAVREMRNGKAPGSDGTSAETYKHG